MNLIKKEIVMFKKTLLCAALVAASGGAMAAATGTATTQIHSTEGTMGVLSIPTAPVSYNLGAMYTQGDTITLTWSQPLYGVNPAHPPLTISDQEVHTDAAWTDAKVAAMDPTADLTVTDYKGKTVTLDDTAVGSATTVAGLAALINAATGTFGMTASGTNAGLVLTADVGGAGSQLAVMADQTKFTGTLTFTERSAVSIPLTVLSDTANSVTYRAGAVPATFNYDGVKTVASAGIPIAGSNQADGTVVSQTFSAATSLGVSIDTGTASVNVAEFHDEFMLVGTSTSKQIDVENARKQFVDDSGAGANAAAILAAKTESSVGVAIDVDTAYQARLTANGTTEGLDAVINAAAPKSVAKINGNYSWLDKASTAAYDIDATKGSIVPAFNQVTHFADSVTVNPTVLGTAVSVATTTLKTVVLPIGTYSADVTAKFVNHDGIEKTKTFANLSLGAWTLNGSTITAYGIPNQAAVTPFLWVQNAGTAAGEITGTASCDGSVIQLGALGTAAADSNTTVGAAVQSAVEASGKCAVGSRYDATLSVNAKASDITVTSGYRVTAADGSNDRLGLETSDSLN